MRLLILGGAGFIGSHVVDALVKRGHRVRVFARRNVETKNLVDLLDRIELVRGDFLNEDDLRTAVAGIDVVVHLVCTTLPKSSNENVVFDVETNVIGTQRLLNLATQGGVRKIVFASSGGTVYGLPRIHPIPETHPTEPICSYGITKLAIEKYLHLYHHLYGLDYAILRFANPYGARQDPAAGQGAITTFLWRILKEEPITIWGDGTVARDYIYISDLVSSVLATIESKTPSKIYNIGSGVPCTLNEVLRIAQVVTGGVPIIECSPARKLDVPVNFLDISRAMEELSWQPKILLEEGMKRTWDWLRHRNMG